MDDNAEKLSQALSVILDRGWQVNIRSDGNQYGHIGYIFDFTRKDDAMPLRMSLCVSRQELLKSMFGMALLRTLQEAASRIERKYQEEHS